MTLGNMRSLGVRSLANRERACCGRCAALMTVCFYRNSRFDGASG
jgi:hypothetical protein